MALGKRVKQVREALGIKQGELGEMIGRSQSYIQSLEARDSQKTGPSKRLAEALGVTHEWLITGEGQKEVTGSAHEPPTYYTAGVDVAKVAWALKIMDQTLDRMLGGAHKAQYDTRADVFAAAYIEACRDPQTMKLRTETAVRLIQNQIEEKLNG